MEHLICRLSLVAFFISMGASYAQTPCSVPDCKEQTGIRPGREMILLECMKGRGPSSPAVFLGQPQENLVSPAFYIESWGNTNLDVRLANFLRGEHYRVVSDSETPTFVIRINSYTREKKVFVQSQMNVFDTVDRTYHFLFADSSHVDASISREDDEVKAFQALMVRMKEKIPANIQMLKQHPRDARRQRNK